MATVSHSQIESPTLLLGQSDAPFSWERTAGSLTIAGQDSTFAGVEGAVFSTLFVCHCPSCPHSCFLTALYFFHAVGGNLLLLGGEATGAGGSGGNVTLIGDQVTLTANTINVGTVEQATVIGIPDGTFSVAGSLLHFAFLGTFPAHVFVHALFLFPTQKSGFAGTYFTPLRCLSHFDSITNSCAQLFELWHKVPE